MAYQRFEKKKFKISTDEYVDLAIKDILQINKLVSDSNLSLGDVMALHVLSVDTLECLLLGNHTIKFGKDDDGNPFLYQEKTDKAKADLVKRYSADWKKNLEARNRFAHYRFQVMFSAICGKDPLEIEFKA